MEQKPHAKPAPPRPSPAASAPTPPAAKKEKAPATTSAAPSPDGGNGKAAGYDPLAPRLRPPTAADNKAREREAKKIKTRIADLERRIAEKEQAVRHLEQLMASPGFYDDRARADQAVADRQRVLGEVAALMGEWESLQAESESNGLAV